MNEIYNFFHTQKLLCKDTNNLKKNNIINPSITSTSILNKYKSEILKSKNNLNKKYRGSTDATLIRINSFFNNLINKNISIEEFCNELFKIKSSLLLKSNVKSNIKNLLNSNKINNKNEIISNPLYDSSMLFNVNLKSSNFINNQSDTDIYLDIISQGKYINMSYPTLGIINKFKTLTHPNSNDEYFDLTSFFNHILYNIHGVNSATTFDNFENNYFKLPIQYLNFGKTICKLLTNDNLNKISSIVDYIDTTDICMKDIMTFTELQRNKKKILLKEKYIIPYEFKDGEIILMKQSKIDKYFKNYKKYFQDEKFTLDNVYSNLTRLRNTLSKDILNGLYKVIYLHCYRNIILFYDIYWNYINKKVNNYIINLKLSNDKIYKKLNYENFNNYIEKMNESLLILKKILLNNLYKKFRPNIIGPDYGIKYSKNNYGSIGFIDNKVIFTGSDLYNNIFFNDISKNYKGKIINTDLFINFDENDYYNKETKLFIGTSYDNNENLNSSIGILNINEKNLKSHKRFNIKIINYIIKIFNNCIPLELLSSISSKKRYLMSKTLTDKEKNNLKNYIINEFKNYIKKSSENIISIKTKNKDSHKKIMLISKINYNISYFIYRIVQTSLYDTDLKNKIIEEINKIKIKYLQIIKEKLK